MSHLKHPGLRRCNLVLKELLLALRRPRHIINSVATIAYTPCCGCDGGGDGLPSLPLSLHLLHELFAAFVLLRMLGDHDGALGLTRGPLGLDLRSVAGERE